MRVVLADDVPSLRRLFRIVLEETGHYEVVGEANDGAEALRVVASTQPDLVLLDLSMPRMDGLEAIRPLLAAAPDCAIVVLSGFEARRLAGPAIELGALGYIEKGATPEELVTALSSLLHVAA